MTLDLYRLTQLIAVAEEGSVTKAAARLHLSQQALSTSLRNLEREVGVDLFDRSGPSMTLLPAGESLVADARVLHGLARSALRRARRIGRKQPEVLRVGHTPAVTGEEIADLVRAAGDRLPGLRLEPHQRYPAALADQLLDGDLDLGLGRSTIRVHGLTHAQVAEHRLSIAVDGNHPLAARESVNLGELAGETIVVWAQPGRSGYTDLLLDLCRKAGFEPTTQRTELQGVPPSEAVVGTRNVAFVTAPQGVAAGGAARVITLEPATYVPLIALWPEHVASAARDALLATITEPTS